MHKFDRTVLTQNRRVYAYEREAVALQQLFETAVTNRTFTSK